MPMLCKCLTIFGKLSFAKCVDKWSMSTRNAGPMNDVAYSSDELFADSDIKKILENYGLLRTSVNEPSREQFLAVLRPGFAGDGATPKNCKICGKPEQSDDTLICDFCDQSFHIACHKNIKVMPKDDEWLCRFCKKKGKRLKRKGGFELFENKELLQGCPNQIGRGVWRDEGRTRTHVRIGPRFQAKVLDWTGKEEFDADEYSYSCYFHKNEVALSTEEKIKEKELMENNLKMNVWPNNWLPAESLSPRSKQNWLQCHHVLYEEGEWGPDGKIVKASIVCGKWRRAPLTVVSNPGWECSCAVLWDPRHADCAVPQELSLEEVMKRLNQSDSESKV